MKLYKCSMLFSTTNVLTLLSNKCGILDIRFDELESDRCGTVRCNAVNGVSHLIGNQLLELKVRNNELIFNNAIIDREHSYICISHDRDCVSFTCKPTDSDGIVLLSIYVRDDFTSLLKMFSCEEIVIKRYTTDYANYEGVVLDSLMEISKAMRNIGSSMLLRTECSTYKLVNNCSRCCSSDVDSEGVAEAPYSIYKDGKLITDSGYVFCNGLLIIASYKAISKTNEPIGYKFTEGIPCNSYVECIDKILSFEKVDTDKANSSSLFNEQDKQGFANIVNELPESFGRMSLKEVYEYVMKN